MATHLAPIVAIVGPTASGKSDLALDLARGAGAEIVSCDSQQVYRGLDIGTAKPTVDERLEVPHHLIDVVEPDRVFSAAEYATMARRTLADLRLRGILPLVVGGTGLYLRALRWGLFDGPARHAGLRTRLERALQRHGAVRLHRRLARVDAEAAGRIDPRDRLRLVRALEVFLLTGQTISVHQRSGQRALAGFEWLLVGLAPSRPELRRRVEARSRAMLERGLIEETAGLLAAGHSPELRPLQAIGYRQAVAVLQGRMTRGTALESLVTDTMRLAKRQMTWFRHQEPGVQWFAEASEARSTVQEWLAGRSG